MKLFTKKDIAVILSKSPRTIEAWLYGTSKPPVNFPNPIKVGVSVRWKASDIQIYIESIAQQNRYFCKKFEESIKDFEDSQKLKELAEPQKSTPEVKRGRGRPRKIDSSRQVGGVL